MNRQRLVAVRNKIKKYKERFDYNTSIATERKSLPDKRSESPDYIESLIADENVCGTIGCIGGFAIAMFAPKYKGLFLEEACEVLDLTYRQGNALFIGYSYRHSNGKSLPFIDIREATAADAIHRLNFFITLCDEESRGA